MSLLFLFSIVCSSLGQTISAASPLVQSIGSTVTVTGTLLNSCVATSQPPTVKLGTISVPATGVTFVSATSLTLKMPSGSGTSLSITITFNCLGGKTAVSPSSSSRVSYANVVSSISPVNSLSGVKVTVSGSNFVSPCSSTIGVNIASCAFSSSTSLLVTVPSGQGVNLGLIVTTNNQPATSPATFSYSPFISSLQTTTIIDSTKVNVVTVLGNNFFAPCSSAVVNVNSMNIAASCNVVSVSVVTISVPAFSTYSAVSTAVRVSATINTVLVQSTFSIDVTGTLPPPSVAPSSSPSASPNAGLIIFSVSGVVAFISVFACLVVAQRKGWCCFKRAAASSPSFDRPPAYAPVAQSSVGWPAPQPQAPAANSREREMASAPPSDSVERQWGGYLAAYDVRQQEHMGGAYYGPGFMPPRNAASTDWPAQQPHAPAANSREREMASAPPSDTVDRQWGGYMAAYDVRQQEHMGGAAYGQASAPPIGSATLDFRLQNESSAAAYGQPSAPPMGGSSVEAVEAPEPLRRSYSAPPIGSASQGQYQGGNAPSNGEQPWRQV